MSVRFDRAVDYYDETRGFPSGEEKGAAAAIARAGKFSGGERVLEIGVGTGRIALPTAPYVRAYFGVDLSVPMMGRLRAKQSDERVFLAQGDATRLPFPSTIFDAAVVVHVFHLIPNWQDALKELARVLRPGGVLLHCFTHHEEIINVNAIMREAFPNTDVERAVGARGTTFLEDFGCRLLGEETHSYTRSMIPFELVTRERQRISSRTWELSDDELEARAQVIEKAVNERFADPHQPVTLTDTFRVQVYQIIEPLG